MEREYLFGVLSVVWQEATHGGIEEEIVNRAIDAIMGEIAAQQSVKSDLPKAVKKCTFDPSTLTDVALGMFHCPQCGEMVVAGMQHPDYSLID